jgi:hypothetical protein
MRKWTFVVIGAALVIAAAGFCPGEVPALSPGVAAALDKLAADDFAVREKAALELQMALGREIRALTQADDPESQARVAVLLTFEQGLCAWVKEVLKKPREQQKDLLDFGLRSEVLPHVAHLYVPQAALRLEAVRALQKNADPHVGDLLAKAIEDLDQPVYVAAMEGVYDRPPTPAVAEALWNRAVAAPFAANRAQPAVDPPRVTFRGRSIPPLYNSDNAQYQRAQDNALATEVLAHLKPPEILPKLRELLDDVERTYSGKGPEGQDNPDIWIYMPSQDGMRNVTRLIGAYEAPEFMAALYRLATGPALQRTPGQINRQPYYWSNRTWAIALVVQNSGQSPADWNLRTMAQLSGMWVMPSERDETAAVAKLREWWGKEHEKYGAGPDTRPAEPAEEPIPVPGEMVLPKLKL